MRRALLASLLGLSLSAQAQLKITPTTTLSAQKANNTSAGSAFLASYQPGSTSRNVSKEKITTLLYPGATTRIYAAVMIWFGKSGHIDAGYNSADPGQVRRQIADMRSRGIQGAILAWYGQSSYENNAALLFMQEAERQGFEFAIMIDEGALRWYSCAGCSPTDALIQHMNYVAGTYYPSPAYLRIGGRPVLVEFGLERYKPDWTRVRASVAGNPLVLFRNANGYTRTLSDGAYAWVEPFDVTSDDPSALKYLDYFYSQSLKYPAMPTFGSGYPGFDDTLASWGMDRKISERCGQTWLESMKRAGRYYSSSRQLPYLQLVTWNDYEEGSSLEPGIDNCLTVTASVSGKKLTWSISGQENTVNHYTVFISRDGENLMTLAELPVGTRSLDLAQYGLAAGAYTLYVRATGKASLKNQISGAVSYRTGPRFGLKASPASMTVSKGSSGTSSISVEPVEGFAGTVSLSCGGLPAGLRCTLSPAQVAVSGTAAATTTLTVSYAESAGLGGGLALAAFGMVLLGGGAGARRRRLLLVAGLALALVSCGGGGAGVVDLTRAAKSSSYSVQVAGTSGEVQQSTTVTVTAR